MASYMACIHSNHTVWTWKLEVKMGLQLDPVHGHLCTCTSELRLYNMVLEFEMYVNIM